MKVGGSGPCAGYGRDKKRCPENRTPRSQSLATDYFFSAAGLGSAFTLIDAKPRMMLASLFFVAS